MSSENCKPDGTLPLTAVRPCLEGHGFTFEVMRKKLVTKLSVFLVSKGFAIENPSEKSGCEVVRVFFPDPSLSDSAKTAGAVEKPVVNSPPVASAALSDELPETSNGASAIAAEDVDGEEENLVPSIEALQEQLQAIAVRGLAEQQTLSIAEKMKFLKLLMQYLLRAIEKGQYGFHDMLNVDAYFSPELCGFIVKHFPFRNADVLVKLSLKMFMMLNITVMNNHKITMTTSFRDAMMAIQIAPLDRLAFGFAVLDIVKEIGKPRNVRDSSVGDFMFSFLVSEEISVMERILGMLKKLFGCPESIEMILQNGASFHDDMYSSDNLAKLRLFMQSMLKSDLVRPDRAHAFQAMALIHPTMACVHCNTTPSRCTKHKDCSFSHAFFASTDPNPHCGGGGAAAAPSAAAPRRVMLLLEDVARGVLCRHHKTEQGCTYTGCVFDHRLPKGHVLAETPNCTSCANPLCCGPHVPECPNVPAPKQKKK